MPGKNVEMKLSDREVLKFRGHVDIQYIRLWPLSRAFCLLRCPSCFCDFEEDRIDMSGERVHTPIVYS